MYTGIRRKRFLMDAASEAAVPAGRAIRWMSAKILAELREERQQIEEAIVSLERLAQDAANVAAGRRPWMSEMAPPKRRGRPPGSKNKVQTAAQLLQRRRSRVTRGAFMRQCGLACTAIAAAARVRASLSAVLSCHSGKPSTPSYRRRAFRLIALVNDSFPSTGWPSIATIKSPPIPIG